METLPITIQNEIIDLKTQSIVETVSLQRKCGSCEIKLQQKQKRPFFQCQTANCRHGQLCIWCCHQKIQQLNLKSVKSDSAEDIECFPEAILNLIDKMKQFIQQNCIICGNECKQEKIYLGQILNFGKKCFNNLKTKQNASQYQNQTLILIQKYSLLDCTLCNRMQYNLLTATKDQKQVQGCTECYEQCLKFQFQNQYLVRKCHKCKQPEIIQSQRFLLWYNHTTILGLIERKMWHKFGQPKIYCLFCYYKQYLGYEEHSRSLSKINFYEQLHDKIIYQVDFANKCLICSTSISNETNVYLIENCYSGGILSFVCQKCQQKRKSHQSKYRCLQYSNNFLKQTNRQKQFNPQLINKNLFENMTMTVINELKKFIRFEEAQLREKMNFNASELDQNIDRIIKQSLSPLPKENVQCLKCQICKSKQVLKKTSQNTSNISFGSLVQKNQTEDKQYLLTQFKGQNICHYCIFQKIIEAKSSFEMEQISEKQYVQDQIIFQQLFADKCILCGVKFSSNIIHQTQTQMHVLFYAIANLHLGFCTSCQQNLFRLDSMPNRAFMKFKVLLKEKQVWQSCKSRQTIMDATTFQGLAIEKIEKLKDKLFLIKQDKSVSD